MPQVFEHAEHVGPTCSQVNFQSDNPSANRVVNTRFAKICECMVSSDVPCAHRRSNLRQLVEGHAETRCLGGLADGVTSSYGNKMGKTYYLIQSVAANGVVPGTKYGNSGDSGT